MFCIPTLKVCCQALSLNIGVNSGRLPKVCFTDEALVTYDINPMLLHFWLTFQLEMVTAEVIMRLYTDWQLPMGLHSSDVKNSILASCNRSSDAGTKAPFVLKEAWVMMQSMRQWVAWQEHGSSDSGLHRSLPTVVKLSKTCPWEP